MMFNMFMTFFKIGAFTFGGGYAMLPLIQREVVDENEWLTQDEFMDILAIAEATPGPVAVNTSTYVGYKLNGIKGSLICTLGTILPSFAIILVVARFLWQYRDNAVVDRVFLGIRPAVAALIFSAVYMVGKNIRLDTPKAIIAGLTALAIVVFDISPPIIIFIGAFGSIIYFKSKEKNL